MRIGERADLGVDARAVEPILLGLERDLAPLVFVDPRRAVGHRNGWS